MAVLKKRQKPERTPAERLQHTATGQIHRELKKVKAFLVQRLVKKCRKLREGRGGRWKKEKEGLKKKEEEKEGEGSEEDEMEGLHDDDEEKEEEKVVVEEEDKEKSQEGRARGAPTSTTPATTDGTHPSSSLPPSSSSALSAVLAEIQQIKTILTPEAFTPICLRRLGVAYTGTEYADLSSKIEEGGTEEGKEGGVNPLVQAMRHPRMVALLKELDGRVTDLRRGGDGKKNKPVKKIVKRKRTNPTNGSSSTTFFANGDGNGRPPRPHYERQGGKEGGRGAAGGAHRVMSYDGSSVFVESLSGYVSRAASEGGGEEDEMDTYGYKEAKKNRPGQRARRQRFDAMQEAHATVYGEGRGGGRGGRGGGRGGGGFFDRGAPRGGGVGRQGLTRPFSPSPSSSSFPAPYPTAAAAPAAAAPAAAAAANLHPSWMAKQAQKAKEGGGGIGAFQGKKITFGDDG